MTNVSIVDTSGFVLKTENNTHKSGIEKKIDVTAKKIPDISKLKKNIL